MTAVADRWALPSPSAELLREKAFDVLAVDENWWHEGVQNLFMGLALYVIFDPERPSTYQAIQELTHEGVDPKDALEWVLSQDGEKLDRGTREALESYLELSPVTREGIESWFAQALAEWIRHGQHLERLKDCTERVREFERLALSWVPDSQLGTLWVENARDLIVAVCLWLNHADDGWVASREKVHAALGDDRVASGEVPGFVGDRYRSVLDVATRRALARLAIQPHRDRLTVIAAARASLAKNEPLEAIREAS